MIRKSIINLLFLASTSIATVGVQAQTNYMEGEFLTIGIEAPNPQYGIAITGKSRLSLWGPVTGSSFRVETDHTYTYLYGTGLTFYFYDADTSTYNDIRAEAVRLSANGEIYDSYTDPKDALTVLRALRPVSYSFKGEQNASRSATETDSVGAHIGFIAQEVADVLSEDVKTDQYGNLSIRYSTFIPVAVHSIRAINDRIERNRQILDTMESNFK